MSQPEVKDSTALNHVAGQKSEASGPLGPAPLARRGVSLCPWRHDRQGRGFLWEIPIGPDRRWCHQVVATRVRRDPTQMWAAPPLLRNWTFRPFPPASVSHGSQERR